MDVYRNLIKQTLRLPTKDPKFKSFLLSTFKINIIAHKQPAHCEKITKIAQNLTQIMVKIRDQITKKGVNKENEKQLHLSYVKQSCAELPGLDLGKEGECEAFGIYCEIQFYYLVREKKIFPKKVIANKGAWQDLLAGLPYKISHMEPIKQLNLRVPLPKQKLSSLL